MKRRATNTYLRSFWNHYCLSITIHIKCVQNASPNKKTHNYNVYNSYANDSHNSKYRKMQIELMALNNICKFRSIQMRNEAPFFKVGVGILNFLQDNISYVHVIKIFSLSQSEFNENHDFSHFVHLQSVFQSQL